MNQQDAALQNMRADDEIDLKELFGILWAERWLIVGITSFAAVISVVVSLMLTEIYRAETVLAAADTEQSSSMMAQLGGAAALLGVNVGSNSVSNINTAIATLRSHQFIARFIEQNDLLVPLFAAKWDKKLQQSVTDASVFNSERKEWYLEDGAPTVMDAYRKFIEILTINGPDRNTGIVSVSINWQNPQEAATWVNKLVSELNREIRARDVREASNAIAYLSQQIENTQLVDMQKVLYQLIESQTRITMLADVREQYVFRIIDPAVVPDIKSGPSRVVISIVGAIAGVLFALIVVAIKSFLRTIDGNNKSGRYAILKNKQR